jgi:hypothetical protein
MFYMNTWLSLVFLVPCVKALSDCSQFVSTDTSQYPFLYARVPTALNFSDAWSFGCQTLHPNSNLVILRDFQTQSFLYYKYCQVYFSHWIGFNHSLANPIWTWYDGVTIGQRGSAVWQPGQPGQLESCANLGRFKVNQPYLEDNYCSKTHSSFCELSGKIFIVLHLLMFAISVLNVNCSSTSGCPPRMYRDISEGTPQCTACPEGTFNNVTTNQTSCLTCLPGRYSSRGAHLCTPCDVGFSTSSIGASSCEKCPKGTYSSTPGSAECTPCPGYTYSSQEGATSITSCFLGACPEGYMSFKNGSCSPCEKGSFLNGDNTCQLCEKGKYSESVASLKCSECTFNSYNSIIGATTCSPCPVIVGVVCPPGSQVPLVGRGLFRSLELDPVGISECQPSESCLAGGNGSTPCADGYEGLLCSSCSIEWFRSGSTCVKCMPKALRRLVLVLCGLVFLLAVTKILKSDKTIPPSIKVCLTWFQFIFLYPTLTSKWPSSLSWIFSIGNMFNFDIGYLGASCEIRNYSYYSVTLLKIMLPIVAFCVILLVNRIHSRKDVQITTQETIRKSTAEFLFLLCFFSVQLCSSIQSIFNCSRLSFDGTFRLSIDPSVICYDSQWKWNFSIHIIMLLLYYALFPALVLWHLFSIRKSADFNLNAKSSIVGLCVKPLRTNAEWFELFKQYHRFFFILVRDGIQITVEGKVAFYTLLILVLQYVEGKVRPFASDRQNDISQM